MAALPAHERQLNLILALQHTRFGLTKRRILETVAGYAEDQRAGVQPASLERRFERDKDALRRLGIEVIAADDPSAPGDNQLIRYHISEQDSSLPDDLDDESLSLITAAVVLLGTLDQQQVSGVRARARALGAPRQPLEPGLLPELAVYEPNLRIVQQGVLTGTPLEFAYHTQHHAQALPRLVIPVSVLLFHGRWYLHAVDVPLAEPRTFLLQRIVGLVREADAATQATQHTWAQARDVAGRHDPAGWAQAARDGLDELWRVNVAELEVRPASEASVRLADALEATGDGRFLMHYTDAGLLADELAGFGADVLVLAPASLRQAVIDRLRRVSGDHAPVAQTREASA